MVMLRPGELAEPDRHHLKQPALDRAREVGVPLHPADQHNAITLEGVAIHEGLNALGSRAERKNLERTENGTAHRLFDNSVMGEHVRLTFGRGGAMATHRRKDEWPHAVR